MFRPASGDEEKGPAARPPVKAARVAARGKGEGRGSKPVTKWRFHPTRSVTGDPHGLEFEETYPDEHRLHPARRNAFSRANRRSPIRCRTIARRGSEHWRHNSPSPGSIWESAGLRMHNTPLGFLSNGKTAGNADVGFRVAHCSAAGLSRSTRTVRSRVVTPPPFALHSCCARHATRHRGEVLRTSPRHALHVQGLGSIQRVASCLGLGCSAIPRRGLASVRAQLLLP